MKKLLSFLFFILTYTHASGQTTFEPVGYVVEFNVCIVDPVIGGGPVPKSPIQPPTVSIDGHTLYLYNIGYSFTLALRDENDSYVYVTNVPAGSTSIVLPSDLSGDYTLVLYPGGDYYFEGEITL